MMNGKLYPISEIFISPQGEGVYAGQMQTFIRLAGCTVGKPYPKEAYGLNQQLRGCRLSPPVLPIYTERCTLYDGREFPCDTDYRVKERLTAEQIIEQIPASIDDVCITGGEPLMHDLSTLFTYLWGVGRKIHIETSGTINRELSPDIWVTCSPKYKVYSSMLKRANEVKLLVDKNFDITKPIETFPSSGNCDIELLARAKPVFLQPVNGEHEISAENLKLCLELQIKCPAVRVSLQAHKAMSSILKEMIR